MEDGGLILADRVYDTICGALARGDFVPGQKIKIRSMAMETGTSLTPVREALNRLVAENVLWSEANKSTIVPFLSGSEIRELRDIRILNETFATRIAASKITKEQIGELRSIANALNAARNAGDMARDLRAINDFQFALYQISAMPLMLKIIRMLWLKSGPYLKVLFPDYIVELKRSRGDWRGRLCDALDRTDIDAACQEIHSDIHDAMSYVAAVMDAVPGERKVRQRTLRTT